MVLYSLHLQIKGTHIKKKDGEGDWYLLGALYFVCSLYV